MKLLEFLLHQWYWTAAALVSGGLLLWPLLRGDKGSVTPQAATLMMNRENALVVDVRDAGEWNSGHIANARHIALGQLDKHLTEIEKYKQTPVIVCCAMGSRAQTAAEKLRKQGFEKVFNLAGGLSAWSDAGLPLTKKA